MRYASELARQSKGDRRIFCTTLKETCGRTGWEVYAWCLMGNLLILGTDPDIVTQL